MRYALVPTEQRLADGVPDTYTKPERDAWGLSAAAIDERQLATFPVIQGMKGVRAWGQRRAADKDGLQELWIDCDDAAWSDILRLPGVVEVPK